MYVTIWMEMSRRGRSLF